ncbi:hypothetical protein JTE90_023422 [Oedothorax gibbosus]|uniref:Reelin domain-containing protein n=1 Tax=Oedothorax gibbosus TaxID=931172 RepID=A0AAV6U398_9ARAC|nr:hypothetical protein JTE90_023422 [Oedothorax gibbosus]
MRTQGLPLPSSRSPYVLLQTAVSYKPGQVINVSIQRLNSESSFKGFMVQAIEKSSSKYIGTFLDADGLRLVDECSAVLQSDNKPKTRIQLAWVAPLNQRGDVIFRGTIVEHRTQYYDNLISQPEPQK